MWRYLATPLLSAGCNTLFGIHDLVPDASTDPCTGTCECKVDEDCVGPHTACLDQVTSRTCVCAAGYTNSAGACAWSGVVDDPGFNQPTDMWTLAGTTSRQPTAAQGMGMLDPGQLALQSDDNCGNPGQASQMITLPRRARAEPLVLRATYASTDVGQRTFRPLIGVGAIWYGSELTQSSRNFVTSSVCLGAAQYAPESSPGPGAQRSLTMAMTSLSIPLCDAQKSGLNLDHVEIVPATADDDCPDPGQLVNGDAEGNGGWKLQASGTGRAAIAPGVGANGSKGVQLQIVQRCDGATAILPVSVPLDATSGATLSLYHTGPSAGLSVQFGQSTLPLSGTGGATVDRYCLAAPLRGGVFSLQAHLNGGAGTCTDLVNLTAVIDDVVLGRDPQCGGDPGVANPGFEFGGVVMSTTSMPGQSMARVMADPTAHGGQQDLQLTVSNYCGQATYSTPISTPALKPGEGVGVSFWYREPGGGSSALQVTGPSLAFIRDNQWHKGQACLPSLPAGQSQAFSITLKTGITTCAPIAPETVSIDDLAVSATAMCASP